MSLVVFVLVSVWALTYVGHRPKWCFRLRLVKRSLDELKDESSSSNGTASVRLRNLNCNNE